MKKVAVAILSAGMLAVLAAVVMVGGAFYWYQAAGSLSQDRIVLISPGLGSAAIADALSREGVIGSALGFRIMSMIEGQHRRFKAGEYRFTAAISPKEVADLLVSGRSITHAITVPEGKNSREIIALLRADDRLSGDISADLPEGSLLPDTHHIHRGDTRASVIVKMQKAMQEMLDKLWAGRAAGLPYASPREALIMASIIEKETGVDGERRKVAGVFVNRLKLGMPLQSDPTVVYALERANGQPMQRPLYRKDWEFDSPYNTYQNKGLPPTPICHPGVLALEAALNPEKHDYLYFVATGRGGHYFAKNLREHNENIRLYKRELRQEM